MFWRRRQPLPQSVDFIEFATLGLCVTSVPLGVFFHSFRIRLDNAQPWHPRHAEGLAATAGRYDVSPPSDGQDRVVAVLPRREEDPADWVSLALGMVHLPLPDGWSWTADPPFGGCFTTTDGLRFDVSVQSCFDPAALSDRARRFLKDALASAVVIPALR